MSDPTQKDERQELIDSLADAMRSEGLHVDVNSNGIVITIDVDDNDQGDAPDA